MPDVAELRRRLEKDAEVARLRLLLLRALEALGATPETNMDPVVAEIKAILRESAP